MGKAWDYDVPQVELWKEVYRVLKPGGYILSFAGSRTYHRMAVNIEDAGFEIRDMLGWLYGSGFPKSHNIGKAVDKLQGNKRETIGERKGTYADIRRDKKTGEADLHGGIAKNKPRIKSIITKGKTPYEGWGTALKPAHEPIVMARKPFNTSVAENVLTHGTGGINIDDCRVEIILDNEDRAKSKNTTQKTSGISFKGNKKDSQETPLYNLEQGRFPANIIHDGSEEVLEVFEESSRFFYCAKASKAERNMGLDELSTKQTTGGGGLTAPKDKDGNYISASAAGKYGSVKAAQKNYHPTVKPIKLMEYLVRLVTPKEGIVLEPFAGSGTTLIACKQQGFNYIGIEREQEYCDIAEARLKGLTIQEELF